MDEEWHTSDIYEAPMYELLLLSTSWGSVELGVRIYPYSNSYLRTRSSHDKHLHTDSVLGWMAVNDLEVCTGAIPLNSPVVIWTKWGEVVLGQKQSEYFVAEGFIFPRLACSKLAVHPTAMETT